MTQLHEEPLGFLLLVLGFPITLAGGAMATIVNSLWWGAFWWAVATLGVAVCALAVVVIDREVG